MSRNDLPPLCLRCGAPAVLTRGATFSKAHGWTFALIFLGGWPYFLGSLLFRHRLRLRVPLCDLHRNHFRWQAGILWGGVAGLLALLLGCFALIPHAPGEVVSNCFTGVGVLAAAWAVVVLANRLIGITAASVDDRQALVVGVSEKFASAYEASAEEEAGLKAWRS